MSNYYNTDDMMYFVKPSRLNRKRKTKWRDAEVERAIAEFEVEAAAQEKSNG